MQLTLKQIAELTAAAERAARDAGAFIAGTQPSHVERKASGTGIAAQIVTDVDRAAETRILSALAYASAAYDVGVLSEEQPDTGERFTSSYFWCVDPLDGTINYSRGDDGYSVSIALVSQTGTPVLGVVYDPVADYLYSAQKNQGARRNGMLWEPLNNGRGREQLEVMYSGQDLQFRAQLERAATAMGFRDIQWHTRKGAVLNACRVMDRAPACFVKPPKDEQGSGCIWDYAATSCLLVEAGASVGDWNGKPLPLNGSELFFNKLGILFASEESIAEAVRRAY